MYERESDILVAEPEEETEVQYTQQDNLFTQAEPQQSAPQPVHQLENKTIKKQASTFVNYNNNNLNKVYKDYDVVKTYVQKKQPKPQKSKDFETYVSQQASYQPQKETLSVENVEQKPKFQLKSKAKVWLLSIILIFAMLGGLSIYNAVHINSLNHDIQQTTTNINNINNDIKQVVKNIDQLTSEDKVLDRAHELGLSEVSDENKVDVALEPKNQLEEYESQTNFFDKICNFFRNLFGG